MSTSVKSVSEEHPQLPCTIELPDEDSVDSRRQLERRIRAVGADDRFLSRRGRAIDEESNVSFSSLTLLGQG